MAWSGARRIHHSLEFWCARSPPKHARTLSLITFSALADNKTSSYALSVRCEDPKTQLHSVRHYRVRVGAGNTYYVSHNRTFQGFSKLIEHYSSARARRPLPTLLQYCTTAPLHYQY